MSQPTENPVALEAYRQLAEAYAEKRDQNAYNRLEQDALRSLLPDVVTGKKILDAGCGPGAYTEWLTTQGAAVTGMDCVSEMITKAQARVPTAKFVLGDLGATLPWEADSFDLIISPLALHYVRDLRAAFKEFYRVLKPSGQFLFSITHPLFPVYADRPLYADRNRRYFTTELVEDRWTSYGKEVIVPSYRRPLEEIINPLVESGFCLRCVKEPQAGEAFQAVEPKGYDIASVVPVFLCVSVVKCRYLDGSQAAQRPDH